MTAELNPSFIKDREMYDGACKLPHTQVPILPATQENLKNYGRLVDDFEKEEVVRMTWPKPGWRDLVKGTGNQQAVTEGDFLMHWEDDYLYGDNMAVGELGHNFVIGRLDKVSTSENRRHILVRDANYHPDGGQVFFPKTCHPYSLLLAAPCGDDVTPQDFVAFAFDGKKGFQIAPNVWHTTPVMAADKVTFKNKQSSVYGCVEVDFVKEFGTIMRVPLTIGA